MHGLGAPIMVGAKEKKTKNEYRSSQIYPTKVSLHDKGGSNFVLNQRIGKPNIGKEGGYDFYHVFQWNE